MTYCLFITTKNLLKGHQTLFLSEGRVWGRDYLSLCVSVCLLSHISPLEHLFVLKILSHTQRATEVKKFVKFCPKLLHCRDPVLAPLKAIRTVGHFSAESTHTHYSIYHIVPPRVLHFSAFIKSESTSN